VPPTTVYRVVLPIVVSTVLPSVVIVETIGSVVMAEDVGPVAECPEPPEPSVPYWNMSSVY
jgi:hypothetical protein